MNTGKCDRTCEDTKDLGHYYDCPHTPVARANYRGFSGNKQEVLCKMHLNSVIKTADRLIKKTGYDMELKITQIDHGEKDQS